MLGRLFLFLARRMAPLTRYIPILRPRKPKFAALPHQEEIRTPALAAVATTCSSIDRRAPCEFRERR